jgi:hypothetical protein
MPKQNKKEGIKSRYPLGEIELRGGRLYLINRMKRGKIELDITSVWHFFNEVKDFEKNPIPPDEN